MYANYFSQAAVSLNLHNTGFLAVRSYNGATSISLIKINIHLNYSNGSQMDYWSLTYRVTGPISNGTQQFPADKLKFSFNSIESSTPYPKNIAPTSQNIGLNMGLLPFSMIEKYFVQNSTYNLEINSYTALALKYDVSADGGDYLAPYSSWNNYRVNLIIEIRNRKGELMDSKPVSFDMQVHPDDAPPYTPTYGMQFDANAKNVLLEFNTAEDYANGLTKTQSKAFSTFSKTGYVVQVNTLNSNLTSSNNQTLPVSAIRLTVKDNQSQAVAGNVILSHTQQNVLSSTAHTAPKFFDTTYSTQPNDPTFFNKSPEQYTGTMIYTMIPQ